MMAGKIRILPEPVAQKIAAGEVVERPASVVKELMENAIDAGASEIIVELKSGGLQFIRVTDNGEGMVPEDVPLALQRFATSKIRQAEDLFAIETLGFRGEALPSIASVSQMVLKTRPSNSISGTKVISEGGEVKRVSETGCPVGTDVEVHDLFYNFPVRRKFLKSIRTELRYALLHFNRVSLAYPSITFKFIHDGRILQELLKTESFLTRVEAILGREATDHLKPIRHEEDEIQIEGFTSLPSFAKGNRDGISIYIHGRYVKDRIIHKAILDGYRHVLPADKYPVSILLISLPPSSVDVNVHPTKAEVKFKEPEKIYQAVWSSIRRALEESPSEGRWISPGKRGESIQEGELQASLSFQGFRKSYSEVGDNGINPPKVGEREDLQWEVEKRTPYRVVGQLWATYILCEAEGTLIFVDQHAAHERILFEKLKRKYDDGALITEKLLLPVLMELSLEESLIFDSAEEAFKAIGFEIESVGERLYAIRTIPSFIEQKEAGERVREMLEELSFLKRGGEGSIPLQTLLISLACHSAVRANFPLRREEMEELIGNLYPFNPSTTCPHGRPVFFLLPLDEMNRQFKRT
ncbi:MAG: DNA mismatch repair endonuclease MutL [Deltaproteobacteria bacterium]|nr:DNA mismatch repair endonuclease MutL [Deltaproteobacteria bacterium]